MVNPVVPDNPIIPFIRGDGTGVDIWPAAQKVIDAAVHTLPMVTSAKSAGLRFMLATKPVISMALTNIYQKIPSKQLKNTALLLKDH